MEFWKMSATGNDFIMLLPGSAEPSCEQIQKLCSRRTGIGADGVIVWQESEKADFKMRYWNADGNEVDMCGNGTRALSYFYKALTKTAKEQFSFETANGVYSSIVKDDYVKVHMTELYDYGEIEITDLLDSKFCAYLNTGVPHCVYQVDNLENYDVFNNGKRIRNEKRFKNGVNTNFFEQKNNKIYIRTYERGVEDETLACGTGVTAVALALYLSGDRKENYGCVCKGGEITIEIKSKDEVYLCGKVEKIYEGKIG